jgi:hypothetical protein
VKTVNDLPTLFVFNRTPVKVSPGFWLMVLGLWAALTWLGSWRWPDQSLARYVLVGGVGALLALLADVGHACAHTITARLANAPMDTILLGADMPRTLYADNAVSPRTHIMRSLGGPMYSALGLLIGIGWLLLSFPDTAVRYLGEVWTATSGGIFLALFAPVPIVDGGVIVKWALVMRGHSEARADMVVNRLGLAVGSALLVAAVVALVNALWLIGGILLVVGLVVVGAARGVIR